MAILARLREAYPHAECSLNHASALELLVATILAAQCTDERVNIVTKDLFKEYKTPEDYLKAPKERLEEEVRTCGFFRQKSASILKTCRTLVDAFDGQVPGTMEELVGLEGVGRKTANVVLGVWFGQPAIIVDTHCRRLTQRLGFTKNNDPDKIERDLAKVWPRESWTDFSHGLVFHGRAVCHARGPKCSACVLVDLCPFPDTAQGKKMAK